MKFYAGIGSRQTPEDVLLLMTEISVWMGERGFCLRSGGAIGADSAFQLMPDMLRFPVEIFKAIDCTNEAMEYSAKFHPNWNACSNYAKSLHGRNAMILLGEDLKTPVEMVICWTPNGEEVGGTGQALRIAKYNNIKIANLFDHETKMFFVRKVQNV